MLKKYGYSGFGYKELSLRRNSYSGPNAQTKIIQYINNDLIGGIGAFCLQETLLMAALVSTFVPTLL